MTPYETAQHAIDQSILTTSIIMLDYEPELEDALSACSDDGVDTGEEVEFWGTEDGREWRVHLRREVVS